MAQHVKLFNALSPSDKQGWKTIAADLSCEHARNIEQDVQHSVAAINSVKTRAQAERAESGLMKRFSTIRLEYTEWAEFFGLWQTPAFSGPSVEMLRSKFFVSPRPPPEEVQDAFSQGLFFADVEASKKESSVFAIAVLES